MSLMTVMKMNKTEIQNVMMGTALQIERGGFYRPDFNRSSESHENPYFSSSSLSYKLYIEKALPAQEGYLPNTEVFGNRP